MTKEYLIRFNRPGLYEKVISTPDIMNATQYID